MADFRPADPKTPAQAILVMLHDGKWHSGLELRERGGGHNYTARIGELRLQGYNIQTSDRRGSDGFALYRLAGSVTPGGHVVRVRCEFTFDELHALVINKKAPQSMKTKLEDAYRRAKERHDQYLANMAKGQDAEAINAVLDEILGMG